MSISLAIRLFGDFYLAANEHPITGLNSERLQALLAFILLHRDAPQSRQQVAVQLWPEATDTDAKANLRRRLHELKHAIPNVDRWLRVETKTIQWSSDEHCYLDIEQFETAMTLAEQAFATPGTDAQPALEQAAKVYAGDLLPSCYDDWIVPYRDHLRQQAIAGLDQLITLLMNNGDRRLAIGYAQQLQRIDPLYEPAYGHLMRLHAQEGDRASALRVYHQCMTTLQTELGVNPSPTTCKLYENLLILDDAPSPPSCTASAPVLASDLSTSTGSLPPIRSGFPSPSVPLVGREREWRVIQNWRSHCLEQECPDLLLLLGESGIGKTRLLEELANTLQSSGYVLWGRGFEAELLRPYGVWVDSFQAIGATTFLDEMKSLVLNATSAADLNRGRLFDLAVQFISQLANTAPVLVVLDDLQWIDETSIAFLHYAMRLLRPPVPVWFACAARKRDLEENLPADKLIQTLHRERHLCTVDLFPLDQAETLALAQTIGSTIDGDRLFTSSGGNPLFALELLRAPATGDSAAPDTLEMLIQGRLRQLDDAPRELIPWAAALGHSFNPTILATVADYPLPRLLDAIEQLEQYGIIRPGHSINGEISYNFAHDIVRQVAYEQLSEPRRQLIHTHIAQALEAIADPTSALINDVAHHADLGSNHAIAARACLMAAERCLQFFAYAEAAELSQRGLRHCAYLGKTERIHGQLQLLKAVVKAGVEKGKVEALRQDLYTLIQEAASLGRTDDESTGLEALIILNYDHGNLSEVQRYSLQAAERGRIASPATTMYMLAHSGSCLAEIGREMARAEALLLEAQSLGDRLGTTSIDIPFGLGCVYRHQGEVEAARSHLNQGWKMAQIAQDHWRECTCLTNLVMLELETGNPDLALEYTNELIHVAAQMGDGSEAPHAAALHAVTQYLLNDKRASDDLERSLHVLQQIDSPRMLAFVQTIAAQWDLEQGDLAQAVLRAEAALEAAQVVDNPSAIALAWAIIIQASQQRGNAICAHRHFTDLKTQIREQALSHRAQQRIEDLKALIPSTSQGGVQL